MKLNWYRDYDGTLRANHGDVFISIIQSHNAPDACAIVYDEWDGVIIDDSSYITEEDAQRAAEAHFDWNGGMRNV